MSSFKRFFTSKESTNKKRINAIKTITNWRILKKSRLNTYPLKLTICPGNICNLKCPLCPVGNKDTNRKPGWMTFETFKKIMDECGPYLYELDLFNWGEPLLNKDILKMIKEAKKHKIKVTISTNLNHLTEELTQGLLDSKLNTLIVSLDGASQKTVEKYQKGSNYKKVLENVKTINKFKKAQNTTTPEIRWRFLINKHNEKEIEIAKATYKKLGFNELELCPFRCDMGSELLMSNPQQFENVREWLPTKEISSMYNYEKKGKKEQKSSCVWLWTQATINWNGSVSPCCAVWHETHDYGNINKNSFKQIWNNEKYTSARNVFLNKKQTKETICRICKGNRALI